MFPWYTDRQMALLLFGGFNEGFLLPPFQGQGCVFEKNLKSALDLPEVVREKIFREIQEGRVAGPFLYPPFHNFRISPLGVVPKKEKDSYRLIHQLSFPKGNSLNDQISEESASVRYSTFEDALLIHRLGQGVFLAKADVQSTFRLLPNNPLSFNSVGFYFDDCFFFDRCLPMGCSLSCTYFEAFTTFIEWVVKFRSGSCFILHYLDDFLFLGHSFTDCANVLNSFIKTCDEFNIPLAQEKTIPPHHTFSFLRNYY